LSNARLPNGEGASGSSREAALRPQRTSNGRAKPPASASNELRDPWVAQQARNLIMQLGDERPFRFLIRDRDRRYSHAFDELFRSEAITVIRTPVQAPNANAHAERWVRTLRADCLDRILILGRRHLEHVLRVYRRHYNEHRPHRALRLLPPTGRDPTEVDTPDRLQRRDLLGGLIHEYEAA
jgi:putative transposase